MTYTVSGGGVGTGGGPGGGRGNATAALGRILRRGRTAPAGRRVHAVRGVSPVAHHGEAIGLIGSNGRNHDVLLIDESLSTGDARFRSRSRSRRRIDELRAEAGTVFLVSHSNSTVTETCERALWLEAGTPRMDGPAEEVVAAYEEFTARPEPKTTDNRDITV
nr:MULTISPECIES: ABC transporter ATP-binding protein [Streptomyces]